MSFFLLKNSLGAKMKRSMRTFCSNDGSTSTLNQQNDNKKVDSTIIGSPYLQNDNPRPSLPTLEEMILQLELEEEMARKAKLSDCYGARRRMSCVNNSDILRSARNALNQYPRFSLDGRDAMYRSSFGKIEGRRSVCFDERRRIGGENDFDDAGCFPSTLAGESVVWCKPGVVAKLMGLEAVPVPVRSKRLENKERLVMMRRQNLRRRFERQDLERKLAMEMHGYNGIRRNKNGCCNGNGYCVMKPVAPQTPAGGAGRRRYV